MMRQRRITTGTTAGGGMYFEVRLQGIYQNNFICLIAMWMTAQNWTDYFDSIDYDDPNWSWTSAETEINWHRVNKCLNLETGKNGKQRSPLCDIDRK